MYKQLQEKNMQIIYLTHSNRFEWAFVDFMNKAFLLTLLWNNYTFYVDNSVEGEYTKHVS